MPAVSAGCKRESSQSDATDSKKTVIPDTISKMPAASNQQPTAPQMIAIRSKVEGFVLGFNHCLKVSRTRQGRKRIQDDYFSMGVGKRMKETLHSVLSSW